jgi:hypothetical protein
MKAIHEIESEMKALEAMVFTQDQYSERLAAEDRFEKLANDLEKITAMRSGAR